MQKEIKQEIEIDKTSTSTSESEEKSRREPDDDFWYKIIMIADGIDC